MSCGGLVEAGPRASTDDPSDADAAAPGANVPPGIGGGRSPVPDPHPPNQVLRCSFSDGPFLIGTSAKGAVELVVRSHNGALQLYVSNGDVLHRYRLASESPCVLERDVGFATQGQAGGRTPYAVDAAGNVWLSFSDHITRVHPLPALPCTIGPGYKDEDGPLFDVGPLLLDEGGLGGWGLEGPPGKLGRLTLGRDACSVALTDAPWDVPLHGNNPRDAQGRFHVLGVPTATAIGIYTDSGTLVSTYPGKSAPGDPAPIDVVRCAGGLCLLVSDPAGQSLVFVDDDGHPRSLVVPTIKGLRGRRIAADTSGPIFVAGETDASVEPEHQVVIQYAPAPL